MNKILWLQLDLQRIRSIHSCNYTDCFISLSYLRCAWFSESRELIGGTGQLQDEILFYDNSRFFPRDCQLRHMKKMHELVTHLDKMHELPNPNHYVSYNHNR